MQYLLWTEAHRHLKTTCVCLRILYAAVGWRDRVEYDCKLGRVAWVIDHRLALDLLHLAQDLNVAQFAEVELSLLQMCCRSHLQLRQLHTPVQSLEPQRHSWSGFQFHNFASKKMPLLSGHRDIIAYFMFEIRQRTHTSTIGNYSGLVCTPAA